jgi:hypothetical protein
MAKAVQLPKPLSIAGKQGLRYENRVHKQLTWHCKVGHFVKVEHNPWFTFTDTYGPGQCAPDFLLWQEDGTVIIVEVKLTWVEVALHKLTDLYRPVVICATGAKALPLVICRNLVPSSPPGALTLREAFASPYRLLHWPDTGRMLW